MKEENYYHFRDVACGLFFFLAVLSIFFIFGINIDFRGTHYGDSSLAPLMSISGALNFFGLALSGIHFKKKHKNRAMLFVVLSDIMSIICSLAILILFICTICMSEFSIGVLFPIMTGFLCISFLINF